MIYKNHEVRSRLDSLCDKYYNNWRLNGCKISDLSVHEIEALSILMTRADQENDPKHLSDPICEAPNSDIVFELLGRLMANDTKNHDELISDLVSTLKSNAVAYYTRSGSIERELQRAYEIYLNDLCSIDSKADDAYDDMRDSGLLDNIH